MKRFTIAMSGLSEEDVADFTRQLKNIGADQWQLVDGTAAYLLVVDVDTVWGHMDWLRATANGQNVATFSSNEILRDSDLLLHKPLQASELSAILRQLEAAAERRGMPSPATIEPVAAPAIGVAEETAISATSDDPAAHTESVTTSIDNHGATVAIAAPIASTTPKLEPKPEPEPEPEPAPALEPEPAPPMTLGESLLADCIDKPVCINGPDGIELLLDPERGGYTGPAKLNPLRPLLSQSMENTRALDENAITRMREAPALPLTRLLWFAALAATPGKLAPALDAGARYRLARWPQIEREFPRHFRIATAMMKQPGTLGDIASGANAPLGDVIDFINAYSVAGYVACDEMPGAETDVSARSGKSMLSRLRRPFSRGTSSENKHEQEPG